MLTVGLREFRKELSNFTDRVQTGTIVLVASHKEPTAAFLSVDTLTNLADRAGDEALQKEIKLARNDVLVEFLRDRDSMRSLIGHFLKEAKENNKNMPEAVIRKLQSIHTSFELVSDEGTMEDKFLLIYLFKISRSAISAVMEVDYYQVNETFLSVVRRELSDLRILNESRPTDELVSDIEQLSDLESSAVIRPADKQHDEKVSGYCSVILRVLLGKLHVTTKIYTIVTSFYDGKRKKKNFLTEDSVFGKKLRGRKMGERFVYKDLSYEILAIT